MLKCFLDTADKTMCTGCRACELSCPKSAIKMVEDSEGFYFPVISESDCIHCDICRKNCPVTTPPEKRLYIDFYAAQSKNEKELANSSSGGCFITLAKQIIEEGGVVFGCVFDEDFNAVTVCAETYEELIPMQGSKYVQCNVGATYKQAEALLQDGRKVFYTGTPCQIAGLKKYLRKEYENLITMDFLCHGVPSNKLFKENIKYLEKKYKGKLSNYKFRDKSKKGWGMMTSFSVGKRKVYQQGRLNAYAGAFTLGLIDRECCYSCKFVGQKRMSDITVADFWGFKDFNYEFKKVYDGVSIFMVNTDKGKVMCGKLESKMLFSGRKIEEAFSGNASLASDTRNMAIPNARKVVYENMNKYDSLAEGFLKPKNYRNLLIIQHIPRWMTRLIRTLKG